MGCRGQAGGLVCVVGAMAPGLVCRSHANRWTCAL